MRGASQRMRRVDLLLLCVAMAFGGTVAHTSAMPVLQDSLPVLESLDDIPGILDLIAPVLLPKVIPDEWVLKEFVRSGDFANVRTRYGDRYAVDVLFRRAQKISWNNTWGALLISLLATMDHRRLGLRVPVLGPIVWFPLTSEFEEDFQSRVRALPRFLVPDSPPSGYGDVDKLQHFFGSAFLAFSAGSTDIVGEVGPFVERGEEAYVVGGTVDIRDIRMNQWGARFGLSLIDNPETRPSPFLNTPLSVDPDTIRSHPAETQP
jgi:hypothetical protein